jgi:hypothetical protein
MKKSSIISMTLVRLLAALILCLGTSFYSQAASLIGLEHTKLKPALGLQKRATPDLMKLDGVLGTAVGVDENDNPTLIVYVDEKKGKQPQLPPDSDGVSIRLELTDKIVAFGGHKSRPASPIQTPPIQLGTSGGWSKDLANGYCCGGTLGALVQANGVLYIMSNYHVFESDTVSGGNAVVAQTGDPIIQPGLIDVNCNAAGAQVVGTLVKVSSLPGSNVDVSVAKAASGMVSVNGAILGIGTISSTTLAPSLNLGVKKTGRTTGLSSSTISGLNATISVAYENECAGGTAFTKTFTGQIVVSNKGQRFLGSGDSGSLMVENVNTNPRAVGLLYAGSSSTAIANPVAQVLQFLSTKLGGTVTMVGN